MLHNERHDYKASSIHEQSRVIAGFNRTMALLFDCQIQKQAHSSLQYY